MHSNKLSIIIGLIILMIVVCLFVIYFHKQASYTFKFIRSIYDEIFFDRQMTYYLLKLLSA